MCLPAYYACVIYRIFLYSSFLPVISFCPLIPTHYIPLFSYFHDHSCKFRALIERKNCSHRRINTPIDHHFLPTISSQKLYAKNFHQQIAKTFPKKRHFRYTPSNKTFSKPSLHFLSLSLSPPVRVEPSNALRLRGRVIARRAWLIASKSVSSARGRRSISRAGAVEPRSLY